MIPFSKPLTPADEERLERERVARKKPHLALVRSEQRSEPKALRDPYVWVSVAEICPVEVE